MDLFEYQAKELFAAYGVPVPRGKLARTPDEAQAIAADLAASGSPRVVVKAQVKTGGRGKAGGVKLASSPAEARERAAEILGMDIKGHTVHTVLVEEASDIAQAAMNSTPSLAGILANNTVGAVSRGAVFALAGMADRAAEVIEQNTGVKPRLFITGGDAAMIAGSMRTHGEVVPDLVLQGLAVIAAQPH